MTPAELKRLRKRLGLSLTQAGEATEYSRSHYAKLESGQHPVQRPRSIRQALEDYAANRHADPTA